jgi:hypothetical protein
LPQLIVYGDGKLAKVGDVVTTSRNPERYIVLGFGPGSTADILLIGTVMDETSSTFAQTIIISPGFSRSVPLSDLKRVGRAEIIIRDD